MRKGISGYLLRICATMGALIFCAAVIYVLVYLGKGHGKLLTERGVIELNQWEFTDAQGVTEVYTVPYSLNLEGLKECRISTTLPHYIAPGSTFAVLNRSNIRIYVDDELIYRWNKEDSGLIGNPPKNSYAFVEMFPQYSGKTLTIVREDFEFNGKIHPGYVGSTEEVIRTLEKKSNLIQFVLALFLLILSVFVILVSFALMWIYKQEINLLFATLGIFVSACWLTVDSFCFQFVTRTRFVDGLLSYVCTMTIIFPFLLYLNRIQDRRYQHIYSLISLIEMVGTVVFLVLHVTKTANLVTMLIPIDIMVGIGIATTLVVTAYDLRLDVAKKYRTIAIGFVLFMVSTILEIIMINVKLDRIQGTWLIVGLYILFVFAFIQQIVELNAVQKARNEANDAAIAKTKFLANMSHELRTPINSILGMNEMILKECKDPDIVSYSRMISDSGVALLSLINDVLDYSKFEAGVLNIENGIYSPASMHEELNDILRKQAQEKGIEVKISNLSGFPDTLYGDERHIAQILLNIITNAVKFTDSGRVTFTAECKKEEDNYRVIYRVSDTGRGIKKEDMDSIFKPFSRKDMGRNQSIQGVGLGLSITKQLVELMGGTITVESVYGRGSTFCVEIPQERRIGKITDTIDIAKELNSLVIVDELGGLNPGAYFEEDSLEEIDENYIAPEARVLVVDDVASNLTVVREFLKDTTMMVDTAESGKQALNKCRQVRYDVILMDHMMPEPDGIQTMHMIKEDRESLNTRTPIIILTANALRGSRDEYLKEGFDNYLSKPVESKKLIKMVRKYLPSGKVFYKPKSSKSDFKPAADIKNMKDATAAELMEGGPIDIKMLYERFENRESTVNIILSEIVKEGRKKVVLLRELYYKGDIKNYAIEAHGVKGVMASSCAQDLSAVAKSHEMAAKEGRVDFIQANLDDFLKKYSDVLDFIVEYLGKKGIVVEDDEQIDLENAGSLSEEELIKAAVSALNNFDVDKALNVLSELKKVAPEEKMGKIEEIIKLADGFEYDKAIEELGKL